MPKTKRLTVLYGSTLNPPFRFMKRALFKLSPFDSKGNGTARMLFLNFTGGNPQLRLPEFKVEVEVDHTIKNTYLEATYSQLTRERLEEHHRPHQGVLPNRLRLPEAV